MKLTVISNRLDTGEVYERPPKFVFMEVNRRCNLRCNHCDFWKRNDDDSKYYLTREQKRDILEDFAEMNPDGKLVICGGEPMLDVEEYFYLCTTARSLGLRVLSVVNGTRIRTLAMAERMINSGPHEVSISLDDWREAEHDRLRGIKNAFKQSIDGIKLLIEARDNIGSNTKVMVMGLVHGGNYETLPEFYDFVLNDLGCDKLKLNMIQPSFGSEPGEDKAFVDLMKVDSDKIVQVLKKCDETFNLSINPMWLDNVGMYFSSFQGVDVSDGWHGGSVRTTEAICNSYERNVMIDHYGFAKLCFATGFGGRPIVQKGDLKKFWNSANQARERMKTCKIPCGISHSVRREPCTKS